MVIPAESGLSETARVRRGGHRGPDGFEFELSGGALCLDLANTVDNRKTETPGELLGDYPEALSWASQAGALSEERAALLRRRAARRPKAAAAALRRIREVREALFRILSAVAHQRQTPAEDVARLNATLGAALSRRRLDAGPGGSFAWTWQVDEASLEELLWPALLSAAELLTGEERRRVRECAADNCAWLFLDRSRNGSRRWCDMTVCGNRAKARRHRARLREAD